MLPYSPLHHLLLESFGAPLVATSGNVSGEPVLTGNAEAEMRLGKAPLHHNRSILRPADDSMIRVIANKLRLLRAGRAIAPPVSSLFAWPAANALRPQPCTSAASRWASLPAGIMPCWPG